MIFNRLSILFTVYTKISFAVGFLSVWDKKRKIESNKVAHNLRSENYFGVRQSGSLWQKKRRTWRFVFTFASNLLFWHSLHHQLQVGKQNNKRRRYADINQTHFSSPQRWPRHSAICFRWWAVTFGWSQRWIRTRWRHRKVAPRPARTTLILEASVWRLCALIHWSWSKLSTLMWGTTSGSCSAGTSRLVPGHCTSCAEEVAWFLLPKPFFKFNVRSCHPKKLFALFNLLHFDVILKIFFRFFSLSGFRIFEIKKKFLSFWPRKNVFSVFSLARCSVVAEWMKSFSHPSAKQASRDYLPSNLIVCARGSGLPDRVCLTFSFSSVVVVLLFGLMIILFAFICAISASKARNSSDTLHR